MVEKWLLEVEETMVLSIRDVIHQSVNAYAVTPRRQWVIEWPGQVAICVSCIYWTSEVTDAMTVQHGMQVYLRARRTTLFQVRLSPVAGTRFHRTTLVPQIEPSTRCVCVSHNK